MPPLAEPCTWGSTPAGPSGVEVTPLAEPCTWGSTPAGPSAVEVTPLAEPCTSGSTPADTDGSTRGGGAGAAAGDAPALGTPPTSSRRSRRSRRAANPASPAAPGSRMRAAMSSSWSRGAVAPVISVRPALATSAARDNAPGPNAAAWRRIRSSWSSGTCRRTEPAPSVTAATTMRSRSRSRRSSTKRRGSRPVSTTLSMVRKTAPASRAAKASTAPSSSSPSVKPSSAAADS